MKKLYIKKEFKASAQKVYNTMLGIEDRKTYEQWTAAFNSTSSYEGKWEKGAKMYFTGLDDKGKRGGMVSEIANIIPFKFVSIRHYGMLDGDKEITEGPDIESWAGLLENYSFHEENGVTTVTIETETFENYMDSLRATWEKALNELKKLVEG